jgi:hypothetical protein
MRRESLMMGLCNLVWYGGQKEYWAKMNKKNSSWDGLYIIGSFFGG